MNGQKIFQGIGVLVGIILALALIVTLGQMWSQWIVFLVYVVGSIYIVRQTWTLISGRPIVRYGVMAAVIILLLVALNSYLGISIKITAPNPPAIKWPERPAPTSTFAIPPSPQPSPRKRSEGIKKPKPQAKKYQIKPNPPRIDPPTEELKEEQIEIKIPDEFPTIEVPIPEPSPENKPEDNPPSIDPDGLDPNPFEYK